MRINNLPEDFEAAKAETLAAEEGADGWRALAAIYKQRLGAFEAKYLEAPNLANAAVINASKTGRPVDQVNILSEFAYEAKLAEAAGLLPRRKIDQDDFEKLPIIERGKTPSSLWYRTQLGGVWIIGAFRSPLEPHLGSVYMLYRAVITDREQSDN
jgi:hypothetical protein